MISQLIPSRSNVNFSENILGPQVAFFIKFGFSGNELVKPLAYLFIYLFIYFWKKVSAALINGNIQRKKNWNNVNLQIDLSENKTDKKTVWKIDNLDCLEIVFDDIYMQYLLVDQSSLSAKIKSRLCN